MTTIFQKDPAEFFASVRSDSGMGSVERLPCIIITHFLQSSRPFLNAVDQAFEVKAFIAKRSSKDNRLVFEFEERGWKQYAYFEPNCQVAEDLVTYARSHARQALVVLDIGAKLLGLGVPLLGGLLKKIALIIIEDTENGHQKYDKWLSALPSDLRNRVFYGSVARSLLKEPEDFWTGRGLVEATETILRGRFEVLYDQPATVFGYGKIGRSIAHALREKRLSVSVCEIRPDRRALANTHGFRVVSANSVKSAGGYVFLATGGASGKKPITFEFIKSLKRKTVITCSTSLDDEVKGLKKPGDLDIFVKSYLEPISSSENPRSNNIRETHLEYTSSRLKKLNMPGLKTDVYLINDGNPPNFLYGATCGHYIYLVQAGILKLALRAVASFTQRDTTQAQLGNSPPNDLSDSEQQRVFEIWGDYFGIEH